MPLVKDLMLAPRLDRKQIEGLLSPYGFKNPAAADANLQAMASDPADRQLLADILEELLLSASQSADPDQVLNYLERFARAAIHKTRLFSYLKDNPDRIGILARTLGGSPYMAEILIRDPHHFYWVMDPRILQSSPSKRDLQRELIQTLRVIANEQKQLDYLRALKRREMLRIGVRDLLRFSTVEETLTALSVLAESLISAAYWICSSVLRSEHGLPRNAFRDFTVFAMGKLGGGELNLSSDVDLIYVYASDLESAGQLAASDYYWRLSQKITAALNEFTSEGYVYRVDLRLRPEGKAGDIAYSLDRIERYYQSRLGTWERLALLKAWPAAGSSEVARRFLQMVRAFIYELPFENRALEDVRSMKRKIDQQMTAQQQRNRNVKLGTGGIREIELITQSLQVCHGGRNPEIAERNTMKALRALWGASLLSAEERDALSQAYVFLRDVENKLQMVYDTQTHSLPLLPEELAAHARRLGYADEEQFMTEYRHHTGGVSRIFEAILGEAGRERFLG